MIGQRLAHYEILSVLGKGGMGEVWRARDGKLGREVAIKTLPDAYARDPERLARFEQRLELRPRVGRQLAFREQRDDVMPVRTPRVRDTRGQG